MHSWKPWNLLAALVAAGTLAIAGCGGDNPQRDGGTDASVDVLPDVQPDMGEPDTQPDGVEGDMGKPDRPPADMTEEDMPPTPPENVGDPCTSDADCPNGLCIPEEFQGEETGFVGGYCTADCNPANASSCGDGAICAGTQQPSCFATCTADTDCRDGYVCVQADPENSVCFPGNRGTKGALPAIACTEDVECPRLGGCATEADDGYPGGYCFVGCDAQNPCPEGFECVAVGQQGGFCAQSCDPQANDCREGYSCVQGFNGLTTTGTVCAPGEAQAAPIGSPCANLGECGAELQLCLTEAVDNFPGGYCTQFCNPTAAENECGAGGFCFGIDPEDATAGLCLTSCTLPGGAECATAREGNNAARYGCSTVFQGVPFDPANPNQAACIPFGGANAAIGDPCENFHQCPLGGFCIPEILQTEQGPQPTGFPGGYCTADCTAATAEADCGETNACAETQNFNFCADGCQAAAECTRDGYTCQPTSGAQGAPQACLP